jgi:hypothetical protein
VIDMSYDDDDDTYEEEVFDRTKLREISYKGDHEISGSRTIEGLIKFRYNGMDYEVAVDVTEEWDRREETQDTEIDFVDPPDELMDVWDDIEPILRELIENAKK